MNGQELEGKARALRRLALEALYRAQSGHPGSALSTMDVLTALYFGGGLAPQDRFLLSNGHACPALYAILTERGDLDPEELFRLRQLGAAAQGHPHRGSLPGIEISSGSLGQGLSVGLGLARALKLAGKTGRVWVMMSDGEQQEGSTWEAVMYAGKSGLDNLIAIIDKNQYQIDGATRDVMPGLDPLAEKYRAFNWEVREIDGHNFDEIMPALTQAKQAVRPLAIISHTIRGKGVSFMEGSEHWHAGAISEEQYKTIQRELA